MIQVLPCFSSWFNRFFDFWRSDGQSVNKYLESAFWTSLQWIDTGQPLVRTKYVIGEPKRVPNCCWCLQKVLSSNTVCTLQPSLLLNQWQSCASAVIRLERKLTWSHHIPAHTIPEPVCIFCGKSIECTSQAKSFHTAYAPLLFAHSSSFGAVSSLLLNQWQSCESAVVRLEQRFTWSSEAIVAYLQLPFQHFRACLHILWEDSYWKHSQRHKGYVPLLFAHSSSFGISFLTFKIFHSII